MATYTPNLNLKKPATSDKIRITDFNNNADLIDAAYSTVDTSLGKLGGGMAIISTGNVHAAIPSGGFVYVRKHGTLAEGLYTADSAISANATLSSSNVSAVSGGGFNTLNSRMNGMPVFKTATLSDSGTTFTVANGSRAIIETITSAYGNCGVFFVYSSNSGTISCAKLGADTITVDVSQPNKLTLTGVAGAFIRVYQGEIT